jgi:hypothetical protein
MKRNDIITREEIIKRGWDGSKIPLYLSFPYSKSEVIKIENYLTRIDIEWRKTQKG